MLVIQEGNLPVCYIDWAEWRDIRTTSGDAIDLATYDPSPRCFCAFCWGAGRIMEEAANGEGLVPVRCMRCDGLGTVVCAPSYSHPAFRQPWKGNT